MSRLFNGEKERRAVRFIKTHLPRLAPVVEAARQRRTLRRAFRMSQNQSSRIETTFQSVERFCLFVGHPRSGHSVLGTLLNGHKNALISHNLDALYYARHGFGREQLYFLIQERDHWFATMGRNAGGYSYQVPGLSFSQDKNLLVVGDKKAGSASLYIGEDPTLLASLADKLKVPIFVIRHIRHPLDNISSMWTKRSHRRGRSLSDLVDAYLHYLDAADHGLADCGPNVHVLCSHHESLIREPASTLGQALDFLGLDSDRRYLESCAQFIHSAPRRTRNDAPWTPDLKRRLGQRAAAHPLLRHYEFN